MTHLEGAFNRGNSAAPVGNAAEREFAADAMGEVRSEEKSNELTQAAEGYKKVQMALFELEGNLKRSVDDAVVARKTDPARADLLTAIGKAITADIAKQETAKTELENQIRKAGGNPADYILQ